VDYTFNEDRTLNLNVMSVNVRNMRSSDGENAWELRRDLLFEVLRRNRPDVIGTQEAYFPQVEQLEAALPDYVRIGVGRDDGKAEGETCALFFLRSRFRAEEQGTFWFSETPEIPGSHHWTRSLPRICTWARLIETSGRAFAVYNVHLDHESQHAREQSVRLLLERLQGRQPVEPALILGDFNMEEDNPALANLQAAIPELRDAFRSLYPEAKERGTFHGFTGRTDGERIDYIFATPEFQVQEAQILHDNVEGRYPSDHFPTVACIRLD